MADGPFAQNQKPEKVDRAIELRGRDGDTPSARIWSHRRHTPSVTNTHTQRQRPASARGSQPLTHAPTPTARAGNLFASTSPRTQRRADAKKSRRGLRPKRWGQRTRRHPAIEPRTHGSSPAQPKRSSPVRCKPYRPHGHQNRLGAKTCVAMTSATFAWQK